MSAIIGGQNVGVANRVTIHAVRVLSTTGVGSTSDLLSALNYIARKHNSIIFRIFNVTFNFK